MATSIDEPSPAEPLQLGNGLSLLSRLRISLSFTSADQSVKPIDEWQLKEFLLAFVKEHFGISVSEPDLVVRKERDVRKRRRDEPVAYGKLYIWDLKGLIVGRDGRGNGVLEQRKVLLLRKLNDVEMHFGGLKLRCQAWFEDTDDFESMKNSWQGIVKGPSGADHCPQKGGWQPDTLIVKGVPSRWFAEPRVSSKASILVTHTIFSRFGTVRNLDIREAQEVGKNVPAALNCDVWVQYEQYSGFFNAIQAFCGRSMHREGSTFKANYEVSWDKDGYFLEINTRKRKFEKD